MLRFWDRAERVAAGCGFEIHLDGRPLRVPGGAALLVPGAALAGAIAQEWQDAGGAKGGEMSFANTPLTRLAGTAQERIAPDPEPCIAALLRYGETDLLCYRADGPEELVWLQAQSWQPWLDWAADALDARLHATVGVGYLAQDQAALAALRRALAAQDAYRLAGLGVVVPALGSLVLGLAMASGALAAEEAHALALLDESFQARQWGEDAEAASRRAGIRADVLMAGRFMALSG